MVVAALAIEAAAAFIAGQFFSLWAAAAWPAPPAWPGAPPSSASTGLLQSVVHPAQRGGAFTGSETLFQLAWVVGAVLPVGIADTCPTRPGRSRRVVALTAQTVFVAGLLIEPHR